MANPSAVEAACAGAEGVFHEAAQVSVPLSFERPERSLAINVGGTANVVEAARKAGVRGVVLAASSAAYGTRRRSPRSRA